MMRLPVKLATKELRHEWQAASCFVAALVGVLAPLLIILALKNGVITTMIDRLIEDSANRELIAVGAGQHNAAFFDDLRARSDVGFVVPATRSINAQANAVRNVAARRLERRVTMIPSAAGDPITGDQSVAPGAVLLSAKLATDLSAGKGDVVELRIERRIDDQVETAARNMTVAGVLLEQSYGRSAMFMDLGDLVSVERFRDDRATTPANWTQTGVSPETYASFRLYADNLANVGSLERYLEDQGVRSRPRVENVALLLAFQRTTNILFIIIASLALVGFWTAMAANMRGMVERQRAALSLLRFLGLSETARQSLPAIQSLILVVIGIAVTVVLVVPSLALINLWFTPDGLSAIATLGVGQTFSVLLIGLFTALSAASWAVFAIKEITPDEVLRAA